ncbi:MAG: hypothetical protein JXB05_25285 [Myxococcaceae bacterium]|nr:hypothetical protein [Myxococcaceae bacterium]
MTTATATDTRHIRDLLPMGLIRDLQGAQPAMSEEKPTPSIREAIIRWLNQEL